jgi:hypothetical protein
MGILSQSGIDFQAAFLANHFSSTQFGHSDIEKQRPEGRGIKNY